MALSKGFLEGMHLRPACTLGAIASTPFGTPHFLLQEAPTHTVGGKGGGLCFLPPELT